MLGTPARQHFANAFVLAFASASLALSGCAAPSEEDASSSQDALSRCAEPGTGGASDGADESCAIEKLGADTLGSMAATPAGVFGVKGGREIVWGALGSAELTSLLRMDRVLGLTASGTTAYVMNLAAYDFANRVTEYEIYWIDAATGKNDRLAAVRNPGWASTDEISSLVVAGDKLFWTQCGGAQSDPRGSIQSLDLARKGARPVAIASRLPCPKHIAVDDTHVYATTRNALVRIARDGSGGAPEVFTARRESPGYATEFVGLQVRDGEVYWADAAYLWRAPKTDASAARQLANVIYPSGFGVSGQHVYFGAGGVRRVALEGSDIERVVQSDGSTTGFALSGSDVYWSSARGTFRHSLAPAAAH